MKDITIFVNGSWSEPQREYPFTYDTADNQVVKVQGSGLTIISSGPCQLRFLLMATVGGQRLSWADPPIVWKSGHTPPFEDRWHHLRLADDHQIFHLTDPHKHHNDPFALYVQVIDSQGVKRSSDPTIINKPEPSPP